MQEINFAYNNKAADIIINPKNRIYRHLLLILCITLIAINAAFLSFPYDYNIALVYSLGLLTIYLGIVYFNLYVLIPRYLLRNRYWIYIGFLIGLILLSITIDSSIELYIKKYFHPNLGRFSFIERKDSFILNVITSSFLYVICFAGTSITVLFKHWLSSGQQINELEKKNTQTELQKLKSQIYPEFLYHTLEKAGEISTQTPEKSSNILIKLSRFLRYQLYDSTRTEVMLSSEIASLENLLNLEKDLHSGFTYSITTNGDVKLLVPPLLFISLVLYTVNNIRTDDAKNPFINLTFNVKEKILEFTCLGTKSDKLVDSEAILKIERRLELLFGGNYSLSLQKERKSQTIYLSLNL